MNDHTKPTQARSISSQRVRDLVTCLSLANLVLLTEWSVLLHTPYFASPQPLRFLAMIGCSVTFATVFYCGVSIARHTGSVGRGVAKWVFFQIIIVSSFGLIVRFAPAALLRAVSGGSVITVLAASSIVVLPLLLVIHPGIARSVATLLVVVSPCVAFLYARATWELFHTSSPHIIHGSMAALSKPGPRTVLVVFDEMSEYVAFTNRPPNIEMPTFDRLRRQATVASSAYPPGKATLTSIPSFLTGKIVQKAEPVSRSELDLRFLDGHSKSLADSSTILSDAREMGRGTAIIGWYHPYCSILRDVDFCAHMKADMIDYRYERDRAWETVVDIFASLPYFRYSRWARERFAKAAREAHQKEDAFLIKTARKALREFRSGLMVLHLSMPHPPVVKGSGVYFSNLAMADDELAAIREVMVQADTWEDTTLVITTDHWWRTREVWGKDTEIWKPEERPYLDSDEDKRAPFIVKLPGQSRHDVYTPEFNTVILAGLIRESLTGKIRTTDELRAWLDRHRQDVSVHAYSLTQSE